MLFVICLLPLVVSVPIEVPSKGYILDTDNGTLRNIQLVANSSSELDLSGMDLSSIEKTAFDNVPDVESLNLSNNSLDSLPDFVFSNLTKLKNLSLSNNKLSSKVRSNLFVGLENLQLLDISHNPIRHFYSGNLFGLMKSVKILTEGNIFYSISTDVFANLFLKNNVEPTKIHSEENLMENNEKEDRINNKKDNIEMELQKDEENDGTLSEDTQVKLCKSNGIVTSLEIFQEDEELTEGCSEVPIDVEEKMIDLHEEGIKSFQDGWYKLQHVPIAALDLAHNEITEITKETLNNLPMNLVYVNLQGNKIRRISSQIIENDHLKTLNFYQNPIEEIEEGALAKTKLTALYLNDNQLKNLNFVSSLPDTLTEFGASGNHITSISDGLFSKLSSLLHLRLSNNKIEKLQNDVFQGLTSLQELMLMNNTITAIEPNAFKDLRNLTKLYLHHNFINNLEKGTFAELKALEILDLSWNKINKATFADLSKSVKNLYLDNNEIDSLEEGNFIQAPRHTLSLNINRISNIERGAFNLPTLNILYLNGNNLTVMNGDSFEGLDQLKQLWLSANKIAEIPKGSCKNLGSLSILDISSNPFEKLENGALYGLTIANSNSLYIYENSLKEMGGGIFDDV